MKRKKAQGIDAPFGLFVLLFGLDAEIHHVSMCVNIFFN